jgi:hypothetical protein
MMVQSLLFRWLSPATLFCNRHDRACPGHPRLGNVLSKFAADRHEPCYVCLLQEARDLIMPECHINHPNRDYPDELSEPSMRAANV